MTRHINLKLILSLAVLFFIKTFSFAEFIEDYDFGYSLDIPEGYEVEDVSEDGLIYMFTHKNIPVTFMLRIYDNSSGYKNAEEAMKNTMGKLSAKYDIDTFKWSDEDCAISSFNMTLDQDYSGWAVSAPLTLPLATKMKELSKLPEDSSDEKAIDNIKSQVVLICYAPEKTAEQCQYFMFSTMNSLCIKKDFYNIPGIIITYTFPEEGKKEFSVKIADTRIKSTIDKSDADAAQFLINMEYTVLNYYGQHSLWKEAWQRYYRMIFRDSCGRLQNFSKEVFDKLSIKAIKERPDNPNIQYAQYLLSWVQSFDYTRAGSKKDSDFSNLPGILTEETSSDCDSRSMLVCVLLKLSGIDSILLISPEFSHALVAADIQAPGQTFYNPANEREYIIGETTAKITWGMMVKEQADRSKWFIVDFP